MNVRRGSNFLLRMLLNGLPEICIKRAGTELFINIFSFWLVAAKSADSVLTGSKILWFNR
jgi:hypothetical protein